MTGNLWILLAMDDWQAKNDAACCGTPFAPVEQMLRTYPHEDLCAE